MLRSGDSANKMAQRSAAASRLHFHRSLLGVGMAYHSAAPSHCHYHTAAIADRGQHTLPSTAVGGSQRAGRKVAAAPTGRARLERIRLHPTTGPVRPAQPRHSPARPLQQMSISSGDFGIASQQPPLLACLSCARSTFTEHCPATRLCPLERCLPRSPACSCH